MGSIILNLQALELTLRLFLLKAHKQFIDWPKPTDTLVLERPRVSSGIGPGQLTPPLTIEPRRRQLGQQAVNRGMSGKGSKRVRLRASTCFQVYSR
jgi:hypothetical protein